MLLNFVFSFNLFLLTRYACTYRDQVRLLCIWSRGMQMCSSSSPCVRTRVRRRCVRGTCSMGCGSRTCSWSAWRATPPGASCAHTSVPDSVTAGATSSKPSTPSELNLKMCFVFFKSLTQFWKTHIIKLGLWKFNKKLVSLRIFLGCLVSGDIDRVPLASILLLNSKNSNIELLVPVGLFKTHI